MLGRGARHPFKLVSIGALGCCLNVLTGKEVKGALRLRGRARAGAGSPEGKTPKTLRHERFALVVDVQCVLTEPQIDGLRRKLPK